MIGTITGGFKTMSEMEEVRSEIREIHRELHTMISGLDERFVSRREIEIFQNEIRDLLEQILTHARQTNGRVTRIENERIAEKAVANALIESNKTEESKQVWWKNSGITLVAAIVGGIIGHFLPS